MRNIKRPSFFIFLSRSHSPSRSFYFSSISVAIAMASTVIGCGKIQSMDTRPGMASPQSLTDARFSAKKFYLGWGGVNPEDPSLMQNEVQYDVKHTHEIFTGINGGDYSGTKIVQGNATTSAVRDSFQKLQQQMSPSDMFIQYSSTHGNESGLAVGGSYSEIANRILSLPAKEVVVFTMACHSGGLVDAFNRSKSTWQGRLQEGRTLYVLTSSKASQLSSSGPGRDGFGGPTGSAGSAFGHALWKGLSGNADGALDGVKDGFLELGEIDAYVKKRTQQIGGHTPVSTGAYNPGLIMNAVSAASQTFSDSQRGTSDWTEDQLISEIQQEDQINQNTDEP